MALYDSSDDLRAEKVLHWYTHFILLDIGLCITQISNENVFPVSFFFKSLVILSDIVSVIKSTYRLDVFYN